MEIVNEVVSVLADAKISYIILAVATYFLSVFLYTLRWKTILRRMGYLTDTFYLTAIILGGIFFNNITPSSKTGGEPVKIYWLKEKFNVPLAHGTISIFYEKGVEAIPFLILTAYVSSILKDYIPGGIARDITLVVLIIGGGAYRLRRRFTMPRLKVLIDLLKDKFTFFVTLTTSSLVWLLDILRFKLISLALGAQLPLHIIAVMSFLYFVLGAAPLTPGGIGVVEGGFTAAIIGLGVAAPLAIGIVIIERLISYVLSTAIGGVFMVYLGGAKAWKHLRLQDRKSVV